MSAPVAPGERTAGVPLSAGESARKLESTLLRPADEASQAPGTAQRHVAPVETVRISAAKLDARLVEAEEMLTAKLATDQRVADLQDLIRRFGACRKEWAAVESDAWACRQAIARPDAAFSDHAPGQALNRLLEFLDGNHEHLKSLEARVATIIRAAEQDRREVGKLVDDLLTDSKKLLLLPFSTLAVSFPKLVRDLCRDQGKKADLVIRGEEVEIDKRILEGMKDPLIHLLRNCIDHGVETPEARVSQGKPACATITLTAAPVNGSKVEILVADDGAGIDTGKVKTAAIKHGVLTANEAGKLSDSEARALIFLTDVSTSPLITRVSGRGLGLA
ncbi:MAG: hypothetical protein WD941_01755, partial [Opitutus sp.]